jgi:hypothetical protein
MAITRAQQVRQMLREGSMKPVEQAGVMNYMPSEMVTVPKIAKSSPDTPTAKLAYITPEEQNILIDLNLYGSLDGKPNRGPGGIPSLEGDFGSPTGSTYSGGSGDEKVGGGGGGGGFTDADDRRQTYQSRLYTTPKGQEVPKYEKEAPFTYIGGKKYEVLDTNVKERQEAEEVAQARRLAARNEFINRPPKPINTPFPIVTAGLNTAQKFLPYKVTRRFYADDVVGRTVTLPDGTTVTYDFDNYDQYDQLRKEGIINAYGRPLTDAERSRFDDDSNDNQILFPDDIEDNTGGGGGGDDTADEDDTNTGGLALRFRKDGGRINAMDGGMMSPEGGIMDLETGRQMYFLGKLVKKATRAVKKVVKSPLGKAALGAALFKFGPGLLAKDSAFAKFMLTDPSKGFSLSNLFGKGLTGKGAMAGIAALSAAPLLFGQEEEDEDDEFDRGPGLDIAGIRNNPYDFLGTRFAADGGIMRAGYQEGSKEPVAKKTMPLLDMGGKEMDLREDGGFVPIGRMEKADDVPARLSKNEFVFTADAVRNAGEGDVDKGAEVMYNMMKNLESGGEVSEESQGLSGAREMFQTSKRLEEVL